MIPCTQCGTYTQPGAAGCYICNQKNQYQGQGHYNYGPNYQQNAQYPLVHDPYTTVLNHILASLLRLEEKLNEKK